MAQCTAIHLAGVTQLARVTAFQAVGRGFESRLPLGGAHVAQSVERILGKDEVTGSIPVVGSGSLKLSLDEKFASQKVGGINYGKGKV